MKRTLAAAIATVTIATHAHAASVLASGHLFGGPQLNEVACYVNNVGPKSVAVTSVSIVDVNGNQPTQTSCSGQLGKGALCLVYSDSVDAGQLYSCTVKANLLGTLRGSIEMRNNGSGTIKVLNSEALR